MALEQQNLAALHKHWVAADSINYHLRRSIKSASPHDELPKEISELAQQLSVFSTIGVWYALLQVVVEGYRDLGCQDERIDGLLADESHATGLRRFRNATFHYQPDPFTPKLMDFITAADSEKWVNSLNRAFRRFFEERLQLAANIETLRE